MVSSVPDSRSSEATKAWPLGSVSTLTGSRLTKTSGMFPAAAASVMAWVALGVHRVHDDGVDARGDEVLDLVQLLADVVLRILDLQLDPVEGLGILVHSVPEDRQEVVVEERHADADLLGERRARHGSDKRHPQH